ncbi:cell adhesion molecule CEACAM5-like [Mustelus asterias]
MLKHRGKETDALIPHATERKVASQASINGLDRPNRDGWLRRLQPTFTDSGEQGTKPCEGGDRERSQVLYIQKLIEVESIAGMFHRSGEWNKEKPAAGRVDQLPSGRESVIHRERILRMTVQLCTALTICLFITEAQPNIFTIMVENSRIIVAVGENALLSVQPSAAVKSGNWEFGEKSIANWNYTNSSHYEGETKLFLTNGSLLLQSVTVPLSGVYTVSMVADSGMEAAANITLSVLEPVSKPNVTANATNPVEYDSVAMSCFASGTAVSYQWFEYNTTINSDNLFNLSGDNSTLTLSKVSRFNGGFICYAYNSLSRMRSYTYQLNVSCGPDRPNLSIQPDLSFYIVGRTIAFSCSAESNPPAEFKWYLNDILLQQTGSELIIDNITSNGTGNYTCVAFNSLTNISNESTKLVIVIEPVSKPNVTANATNPVEDDSVAMVCFASGTAVSYQWFKYNTTINSENVFHLSGDNSTLTLSKVLRFSGGFTCYAYNSISGRRSDTYQLNVSYGPDRPNLSIQPDLYGYITGRTIAFSCSVESNPPAEFKWYLNDSLLQQKGSELIIDNITSNGTGNYTCVAFNSLTNISNESTKLVIVIAQPQNLTILMDNSLITVAVGGNALLSVKPSVAVKSGKWEFRQGNIANWTYTNSTATGQYEGNTKLFLTNGSLLLQSVAVSHSGVYTVSMVSDYGMEAAANITLSVLDKETFVFHFTQMRKKWLKYSRFNYTSVSLTSKVGNQQNERENSKGVWTVLN